MELLRLFFPQTSKVPRWVILFIDVVICTFSFIFATLLRFNFFIEDEVQLEFFRVIPLIVGVRVIFILYFRIYAGVIRHTSLQDAVRVFYTITFSSLVIGLINIIYIKLHQDLRPLIP